jgi:hypothetical protein
VHSELLGGCNANDKGPPISADTAKTLETKTPDKLVVFSVKPSDDTMALVGKSAPKERKYNGKQLSGRVLLHVDFFGRNCWQKRPFAGGVVLDNRQRPKKTLHPIENRSLR